MDSRNYTLPQDSEERKLYPLFSGVMRFFPAALAGVARHILRGAEKHCAGEVVWRRDLSTDHADCTLRHLMDLADAESHGADSERILEEVSAIAWRALALSQEKHEEYAQAPLSPGASTLDMPNVYVGIGEGQARIHLGVGVGESDDVPVSFPPAGALPFNLKEALAGAPLVTRDGRKAINFKVRDDLEDDEEDYACPYPYSADVEIEKGGAYDWETYRADGGYRIASTSGFDLYMVPVERKAFNLSAALAGAPLVTRSGKRADDFRMDASEEDGSADYPYSARISHNGIAWRSSYTAAGRAVSDEIDNVGDLFMAPIITKAFDLDAALAGAPLVTADGRMVTDFGEVRCEGSKPSHPYAAVVNNEDGSRVWWVYGADGTLGGWKPELSLARVSVD